MLEDSNKFPRFTKFLEQRLSGRIFYRKTSSDKDYHFFLDVVIQHEVYEVIWMRRIRDGFFTISTDVKVLGTIEDTIISPDEDLIHYSTRTTEYLGRLPIKGRLTLFNRRTVVTERPQPMETNVPMMREVRRPLLYRPMFPATIFSYTPEPDFSKREN
ncbi:hypothetical protein HYV81_01615 [Candidatus Woesearchaeota archaeon]|nr:hypothetical protein [Candidatus Woesearchaeota archaeon]